MRTYRAWSVGSSGPASAGPRPSKDSAAYRVQWPTAARSPVASATRAPSQAPVLRIRAESSPRIHRACPAAARRPVGSPRCRATRPRVYWAVLSAKLPGPSSPAMDRTASASARASGRRPASRRRRQRVMSSMRARSASPSVSTRRMCASTRSMAVPASPMELRSMLRQGRSSDCVGPSRRSAISMASSMVRSAAPTSNR